MSVDNEVVVRPKQLKDICRLAIQHRKRLLIVGSPGIGKTDIVNEAGAEEKCEVLTSHLAVADPTEANGLPWPDAENNQAKFLMFGQLYKVVNAAKPMVWFLDDFGQASPATQAAHMRPLLDFHTVSGYEIPRHVTIIAATNKRTDKAGVSGVLEPVKSRFDSIVELRPTLEDWIEWAIGAQQPAELIAFQRYVGDRLLFKFEATSDLVNSPCPRTWAKVGDWLNTKAIPHGLEFPIIAGAVGAAAAGEFTAFLKTYRDLPDPDEVIEHPDKAIIPTEPAQLYAITSALAHRCNKKTFANILIYSDRLHEKGQAEFGVLLIRDSYMRDKSTRPHQPSRKCVGLASTARLSGT
jgi:predicted ATPase